MHDLLHRWMNPSFDGAKQCTCPKVYNGGEKKKQGVGVFVGISFAVLWEILVMAKTAFDGRNSFCFGFLYFNCQVWFFEEKNE